MSVVSVVVVLKCSYSQASLKEQYGCSMLIGASVNSIVSSPDLFETSVLAPGGFSDTPAAGVKTTQQGIVTRIFCETKVWRKKVLQADIMDQEQYMFRPIAEDATVAIEASTSAEASGREAGIPVDVNQPAVSVLDHVTSIRQGYA